MTEHQPYNCDDCQQRLAEFALSELPDAEAAAVSAHLTGGCPNCNQRLTEIVECLAALPHALAPQLPPVAIERQLMQRIAAKPTEAPLADVSPMPAPANLPPHRRQHWASGLTRAALATAACVLVALAWYTWGGGDLKGPGPMQADSEYWKKLEQRMIDADRGQQLSVSPRLEFASLPNVATNNPVHGYVAADHLSRQWHVYVFDLPLLPKGHNYHLWFVTPDSKYALAGIVTPDATGAASQIVDLPSEVPTIVGLALSDEPTSSASQPSSEPIFRARIPQP